MPGNGRRALRIRGPDTRPEPPADRVRRHRPPAHSAGSLLLRRTCHGEVCLQHGRLRDQGAGAAAARNVLKSDSQRRETFVWRSLYPTTCLWQTLRPRHCYLLRVSTVSISARIHRFTRIQKDHIMITRLLVEVAGLWLPGVRRLEPL